MVDLLALVGDVYCIFVTFPCGILGQVWYLIVLFPDLCRLSYFVNPNVFKTIYFFPRRLFFISANSADPDEMPPYAAFHLGPHCLPKYLL